MRFREVDQCVKCKRVFYRGRWHTFDQFVLSWIDSHSDSVVHTTCPDCSAIVIREEEEYRINEKVRRACFPDLSVFAHV